MAQSLKAVLDSLLNRTGLAAGVRQQQALIRWEEAVGTTIAGNAVPEKVEHGVMTVRVATPAWRQELLFQKAAIVEKLNQLLGKQTIKDIRFV